jgi:hypothetical protein
MSICSSSAQHAQDHVDVGARGGRQLDRGGEAAAPVGEQPCSGGGQAFVLQKGVQALRPAGAVAHQCAAQPGLIAQLLDLGRRQPGLGQELFGEQQHAPAAVELVGLGPPLLALQRFCLVRVDQPHIKATRLQ